MSSDGPIFDPTPQLTNTKVKGLQQMSPAFYVGNPRVKGTKADLKYWRTTTDQDETPEATDEFGDLGVDKTIDGFTPLGAQCMKGFNVEINKTTLATYGQLCPDPGQDPQRGLETKMWTDNAEERIRNNFLFNIDATHLYCGGDPGTENAGIPPPKYEEFGNIGTAKDKYYDGPFPARGLPIKFQKVYFYGTRGQISGSADEEELTDPFNARKQSDGRGALFSTYILCASAPVNSLNPDGGDKGDGYDCKELSEYSLEGGTFTYLQDERYTSDDYFLTQQDEYNKGIDVEWDPQNYAQDAPLIIGDGALGFREQSLGKDVFGQVDIYSVTEADKYYEQEVTLCIDGTNVAGTILFKPNDASSFSESNAKMIAHDIRNNFSCESIMPTDTCDGNCAPPLDYQHEKVYIIDDTSILMRTDRDAMENVKSTDKCASEE